MDLSIAEIKTTERLQPRYETNTLIVNEYAQAMEAGQPFPPVEVVYDGENYWLWDGFHRKQAAEQAGLETVSANVTEGDLTEAEWLALSANKTHGFKRSNEDKRRAVRLAFEHPKTIRVVEEKGKPKFSEVAGHCGVSDQFTANLWYESHPKQERSEKIENSNGWSFQKRLNGRSGRLTRPPLDLTPQTLEALPFTDLDQNRQELVKLARLDDDTQIEVVDRINQGQAKSVKAALKKITTEQQIEAIEAVTLPAGKYHVIAVDPPWPYASRAQDPTHRAANPYPPMSVDEIISKTPVVDCAYDDCILWLWTTNAFMGEAHQVARAWGFEVKTILTWVKSKMGTGDWLRGQTEHCLMCVKGKPVVDLTNQTTVIYGPLREHSRKPDSFYELVKGLCPGTKLELFAREQKEDWETHGAEADKFD